MNGLVHWQTRKSIDNKVYEARLNNCSDIAFDQKGYDQKLFDIPSDLL